MKMLYQGREITVGPRGETGPRGDIGPAGPKGEPGNPGMAEEAVHTAIQTAVGSIEAALSEV